MSLIPLKKKGILKKSSHVTGNSPRPFGSLGEMSVTWDAEALNKSGKGTSNAYELVYKCICIYTYVRMVA
jgi:hypothetical protein